MTGPPAAYIVVNAAATAKSDYESLSK